MDGNKKIRWFFAGILFLLSLPACRVQPPGYVSLYIDNTPSLGDTAVYDSSFIQDSFGAVSADTLSFESDSGSLLEGDTLEIKEQELPGFVTPLEAITGTPSEVLVESELHVILAAITDSIRLLRQEMDLIQKRIPEDHTSSMDSANTWFAVTTDTSESVTEFKQLLHVKNDSIALLVRQLNELKEALGKKADTVFITRDIQIQPQGDSTLIPPYDFVPQEDGPDTLTAEPQIISTSSSYTRTDSLPANQQQESIQSSEFQRRDELYQQLLNSKDEQIQHLQQQLLTEQSTAQNLPVGVPESGETIRSVSVVPVPSEQVSWREVQVMKDTIAALRIRLLELQLREPETDTVIIYSDTGSISADTVFIFPNKIFDTGTKDSTSTDTVYMPGDTIFIPLDTVFVNRDTIFSKPDTVTNYPDSNDSRVVMALKAHAEASDGFKAYQDTILFLRKRLAYLEEEKVDDSDNAVKSALRPNPVTSDPWNNATLLVAYFGSGETRPVSETVLLQQIQEICTSRKVTRVTMAGYTDSSGNEAVNKHLTSLRLDYLTNLISPWVVRQRIFYQNFGDTFASDAIVNQERRIDIRIYTE